MNSQKRLILIGYVVGLICLLVAWIIRDNAFELAKPSGSYNMEDVLRSTSAWVDEALFIGGLGFALILLTFHHHLRNPGVFDHPLVVQSPPEPDETKDASIH
jgi:hypothetical protein